jgi:hypothetical protein
VSRPRVAEIRDYGVTVSVAGVLITPEALATMVTVPGATPVASPLLSSSQGRWSRRTQKP